MQGLLTPSAIKYLHTFHRRDYNYHTGLAVWLSGSTLVSINKVTLRRARLVLGWVTGPGFNSRCRKRISVYNQPPRLTQPGHPSVGRRNGYQPNGSDALWLGNKSGMVREWVAGKTVWSPCYHGPYLSTLEMRSFIIRCYTNRSHLTLLHYHADKQPIAACHPQSKSVCYEPVDVVDKFQELCVQFCVVWKTFLDMLWKLHQKNCFFPQRRTRSAASDWRLEAHTNIECNRQ